MATITNKSDLNYNYKIDPSGTAQAKSIESNTISTNLIIGTLDMVKTVDKNYATIGDIINYTIVLSNSGNILLTDVNFKDILPGEVSFVTGSVKVDNVSQPSFDVTTGFNLGSFIIGTNKTVTFQATVTSLPNPNTITNKATATFDYLVLSLITGTAESNSVTTTINVDNVTAVKSASVDTVKSGDEITYTILLTNSGNIDATDITFTDTLDSNLEFTAGSVTIDGIEQATYNPNTGFTVANMTPNQTVTITFKVTVI